MVDGGSTAEQAYIQGWNGCLDACLAVLCPEGHDGERTCAEIYAAMARLRVEDDARGAIVLERVRHCIPRVTVEDFEVLAHMLEDAQHIELADRDRRRRLGID